MRFSAEVTVTVALMSRFSSSMASIKSLFHTRLRSAICAQQAEHSAVNASPCKSSCFVLTIYSLVHLLYPPGRESTSRSRSQVLM